MRRIPKECVAHGGHGVYVRGLAEYVPPAAFDRDCATAAVNRRVRARRAALQRAVDVVERKLADAPDRARRELETGLAFAHVASLLEPAAQVAQDQQRLDAFVAGELAQLVERDRLEISLEQIARHLAQAFDLAHQLERLFEGQALPAAKLLAVARLEVLERADLALLLHEVAIFGLGVRVFPLVGLEAAQRLGQALRQRLATCAELVQALRLFLVSAAQGGLFTVERVREPLPTLVEGVVHVAARHELARLLPQLLQQFLDAHHAEVLAGQLEALVAHPGERFVDAHPLHEMARELVERGLRRQRERSLRAVPAAVAQQQHR